jgi:uncharacterized membrane protein YfcA
MPSALPAGVLAGLVLGYLGAGGTVVGLPFLLYLSHLSPHLALGTNAAGVSLIALALLVWRLWHRQVAIRYGVVFAVPGVIGIYLGAHVGLLYPGRRLIYLLGLLLFVVAGWLLYLSTKPEAAPRPSEAPPKRESGWTRRLWVMVPAAFLIGTVAGFFAIGGGFMIVPGIALTAGIDLTEAAAASLLPISLFSGVIGVQYAVVGDVNAAIIALMLVAGLAGGRIGIGLGSRVSKRVTQRIFAAFLVLLGLYMSVS